MRIKFQDQTNDVKNWTGSWTKTKTVILTDSSTMVNCDGSQLSSAGSHLNFSELFLFWSSNHHDLGHDNQRPWWSWWWHTDDSGCGPNWVGQAPICAISPDWTSFSFNSPQSLTATSFDGQSWSKSKSQLYIFIGEDKICFPWRLPASMDGDDSNGINGENMRRVERSSPLWVSTLYGEDCQHSAVS